MGLLVITLLVGHIFSAAISRIAKVEDDYRKMEELKVRAEAADVAKSQVGFVFSLPFECFSCLECLRMILQFSPHNMVFTFTDLSA